MLEAWIEWKRRCALGLCRPDAREALEKFAYSRFNLYSRRYAHRTNVGECAALSLSGADSWHLLESHLATSETREGKRYKDWLFDRARSSSDPPLSVIQSGASVLMRSVAKELLRREFSSQNMISTNAVVSTRADETLTIEDLLPGEMDPVDAVAKREFESLAREQAGTLVSTMNWREKLVLFAKALGLSLAHPQVEEVAECRKSALNACHQQLVARISAHISDAYPDEDRESVLLLKLLTFNEALEMAKTWGKSEKRLARFFNMSGG